MDKGKSELPSRRTKLEPPAGLTVDGLRTSFGKFLSAKEFDDIVSIEKNCESFNRRIANADDLAGSIAFIARGVSESWLRQHQVSENQTHEFDGFWFHQNLRQLILNIEKESRNDQMFIYRYIETFTPEDDEWAEHLAKMRSKFC